MAKAAINPLGHEVAPEPEAPKIYSDQYRHSIVESVVPPETSMLSLVPGTPTINEYYRQRLEGDEEPGPFNPDDSATYQSYVRIRKLIIKDDGDGAYNFDPTKAEAGTNYTGSVVMEIPPIRGDVFIRDIGDGNAGLFQITEQIEPPAFTANKVYRITFVMVGILQRYWAEELERRVVQEMVYSRDSALSGGVGVISPEDFDLEGELFKWRATIGNWIMRKFWYNPEKTIVWEIESGRTVYDQYLVNFIISTMDPDTRNMYPFINQFSTQYGGRDYGMYGTINIWEVLLRGDWNLLSQCENKATIISVDRLVDTRLYGNLRSSSIDYFVATDPEQYKLYKAYYNMDGYPILRPSKEFGITYLFSEEFYQGNPQGELEKLIVDVVRDRIVPRKRLLEYCKGYFALTPREQIYYGPILMMMIQVSRRFGVPS